MKTVMGKYVQKKEKIAPIQEKIPDFSAGFGINFMNYGK
jgi:hypothetical protein